MKTPLRNRKPEEVKLRFLPDSPEQIAQSLGPTGYLGKLEKAVREAINRVKRR